MGASDRLLEALNCRRLPSLRRSCEVPEAAELSGEFQGVPESGRPSLPGTKASQAAPCVSEDPDAGYRAGGATAPGLG